MVDVYYLVKHKGKALTCSSLQLSAGLFYNFTYVATKSINIPKQRHPGCKKVRDQSEADEVTMTSD